MDEPRAAALHVKGGTAEAGFEVWVEPSARLLRMRVWGAWGIPLAESYESCLDSHYPAFSGSPYSVICDIRDSPIQIPDVAEIRGRCIAKATAAGMQRCAYLVIGTLPRMQMRRIASTSGCRETEFFQDLDASRAWALRPE